MKANSLAVTLSKPQRDGRIGFGVIGRGLVWRSRVVAGILSLFVAVAHTIGAAERQVPAGAKVSLRMVGEGDFILGQTLNAVFTLSNAGTEPFAYQHGGDYRGTGFPTSFKVTIVNEQGVEFPAEPCNDMGGLVTLPILKPAAEFQQQLRLQDYVQVNAPGRLTVRVRNSFGWEATPDRPLPVAELIINVRLPNADEAERMVRRTVGVYLPEDDLVSGVDRWRSRFRYLRHPLFLPALEKYATAGVVEACEGIHFIPTQEATLALTRLLGNKDAGVRSAAALFLSQRMPPRMEGNFPSRLITTQTRWPVAIPAEAWVPESAGPLRSVAGELLNSKSGSEVRTGAFIIETVGESGDGPLVLKALEPVLAASRERSAPEDDILDRPGAGDSLVRALAGLRERGYRAPRGGGVAVILATFLELADARVPRRDGWEELLTAFFAQNPPLLREAAVDALPKPLDQRWTKLLLDALNDPDRGVMLHACTAAGNSGDATAFTESLANIVRTERHAWVVRAASGALVQLKARWPATDAWMERLADEKLYPDALGFLANNLYHPKRTGSSGRTDLSREARVKMREKWRAFFADPQRRAAVESGDPVAVTEAQARDLFSGAFSWSLDNGATWPAQE